MGYLGDYQEFLRKKEKGRDEYMGEKPIEEIIVDLFDAVDNMIDWNSMPDDVRKNKYSIMAKRIASISKSVKSVYELVERILKEIAGDAIFLTKDKALKLKNTLEMIKQDEKRALEYIKGFPYLSVILYAASVREISEKKGGKEK